MADLRFPVNAPPLSAGRRIYAIGDIHGRHDLLTLCLEQIAQDLAAFPCARPQRVFLGDYIDRGPQSAAVLKTLVDLDDGIPTTCLSGNHESYMSRFLEDPLVLKTWSRVGAATTLASYGVEFPFRLGAAEMAETRRLLIERLPARQRGFLAALPVKLKVEGFGFVHAGIRPGVSWDQQEGSDLMFIRDPFLDCHQDLGCFVVHGHSPVDKPEIWPNRLNIDTRAYSSGLLTCAVIEGSELRFLWGVQ
jgi:serine/threonine protein phosphatase 1